MAKVFRPPHCRDQADRTLLPDPGDLLHQGELRPALDEPAGFLEPALLRLQLPAQLLDHGLDLHQQSPGFIGQADAGFGQFVQLLEVLSPPAARGPRQRCRKRLGPSWRIDAGAGLRAKNSRAVLPSSFVMRAFSSGKARCRSARSWLRIPTARLRLSS